MRTIRRLPAVRLNTVLLRSRVPNVRQAAASVGLRPATVSNLLTGKKSIERAEVRTLVALADLARCDPAELLVREPAPPETFAASIEHWAAAVRPGSESLGEPQLNTPLPEAEGLAVLRRLPRADVGEAGDMTPAGPFAI